MTPTGLVIPDIVQEELDKLSVPYRIEGGKKHGKLFVNGILCGAIPRGGKHDDVSRFALNLRSQVRRAAAGKRDRK